MLIKKLLPKHLGDDSPDTSEVLALGESIVRVGHIYRNFCEVAFLVSHLIDKFGTVFHTIHSQTNFLDGLESHHTISVVGVRKPHSAHEKREELSSEQCESSKKWNISMGFHDKTRAEHKIECRILCESFHEGRHILYMVLPISIECHDVFYTEFVSVAAHVFESGLESRTPSAIERMMDDMERRKPRKHLQSIVPGTVVDYEDMRKSGFQNRVYHGSDSRRFVIGSYQKDDIFLIYGHAAEAYLLKRLFPVRVSLYLRGFFRIY